MNYKTISIFIDVDTGEILPYHRAEQLKYTNYKIINKTKKNEQNESERIIRITNECRHTGQREINFKE